MASVRIITVDYYISRPISELDQVYSTFRGAEIRKVPVIQIFGNLPTGEKACLHVHGVYPYIYIPYDGKEEYNKLSYKIASELDKGINTSFAQSSANTLHVHSIELVSTKSMYGYHERECLFLKIYFYNPIAVKHACTLLQSGSILGRIFQPHESHIPFILQFMIDYKIRGMDFIKTSRVKYRRKSNKDFENPQLEYLPADVVRLTHSEIEIDTLANDIINAKDVSCGQFGNPGLEMIWEDERQRRRNQDLSSQVSIMSSDDRPKVKSTGSHKFFKKRFFEKLEAKRGNETNSELNKSVYAMESLEVPKDLLTQKSEDSTRNTILNIESNSDTSILNENDTNLVNILQELKDNIEIEEGSILSQNAPARNDSDEEDIEQDDDPHNLTMPLLEEDEFTDNSYFENSFHLPQLDGSSDISENKENSHLETNKFCLRKYNHTNTQIKNSNLDIIEYIYNENMKFLSKFTKNESKNENIKSFDQHTTRYADEVYINSGNYPNQNKISAGVNKLIVRNLEPKTQSKVEIIENIEVRLDLNKIFPGIYNQQHAFILKTLNYLKEKDKKSMDNDSAEDLLGFENSQSSETNKNKYVRVFLEKAKNLEPKFNKNNKIHKKINKKVFYNLDGQSDSKSDITESSNSDEEKLIKSKKILTQRKKLSRCIDEGKNNENNKRVLRSQKVKDLGVIVIDSDEESGNVVRKFSKAKVISSKTKLTVTGKTNKLEQCAKLRTQRSSTSSGIHIVDCSDNIKSDVIDLTEKRPVIVLTSLNNDKTAVDKNDISSDVRPPGRNLRSNVNYDVPIQSNNNKTKKLLMQSLSHSNQKENVKNWLPNVLLKRIEGKHDSNNKNNTVIKDVQKIRKRIRDVNTPIKKIESDFGASCLKYSPLAGVKTEIRYKPEPAVKKLRSNNVPSTTNKINSKRPPKPFYDDGESSYSSLNYQEPAKKKCIKDEEGSVELSKLNTDNRSPRKRLFSNESNATICTEDQLTCQYKNSLLPKKKSVTEIKRKEEKFIDKSEKKYRKKEKYRKLSIRRVSSSSSLEKNCIKKDFDFKGSFNVTYTVDEINLDEETGFKGFSPASKDSEMKFLKWKNISTQARRALTTELYDISRGIIPAPISIHQSGPVMRIFQANDWTCDVEIVTAPYDIDSRSTTELIRSLMTTRNTALNTVLPDSTTRKCASPKPSGDLFAQWFMYGYPDLNRRHVSSPDTSTGEKFQSTSPDFERSKSQVTPDSSIFRNISPDSTKSFQKTWRPDDCSPSNSFDRKLKDETSDQFNSPRSPSPIFASLFYKEGGSSRTNNIYDLALKNKKDFGTRKELPLSSTSQNSNDDMDYLLASQPCKNTDLGISMRSPSGDLPQDEDSFNLLFDETHITQNYDYSVNMELSPSESSKNNPLDVVTGVLMPVAVPPTREKVLSTLQKYNIPEKKFQEPFYGDYNDVTGGIEIGHNLLKIPSKSYVDLDEFPSKIAPSALESFRNERFQNLNRTHDIMSRNIRSALSTDGKISITPLKIPPTPRQITLWLKLQMDAMRPKSPSKTAVRSRLVIPTSPDNGNESCDDSITLSPCTPVMETTTQRSPTPSDTSDIIYFSPLSGKRSLLNLRRSRRRSTSLQRKVLFSQTIKSDLGKIDETDEKKSTSDDVPPGLFTSLEIKPLDRNSNDEKSNPKNEISPRHDSCSGGSTKIPRNTFPAQIKVYENVTKTSFPHNDTKLEQISPQSLKKSSQTSSDDSIPDMKDVLLKPIKRSSNNSCEITGVSLNNTHMCFENYHDAKAVSEYQHITLLILEVHVQTRVDLNPDPQYDPVRAIFYTVFNDVPPESIKPREETGVFVVDTLPGTPPKVKPSPLLDGSGLNCKITYVKSEREMIDLFVGFVRKIDPDIVAGYEIEMSSWGYLVERCSIIEINLRSLLSRLVQTNEKESKEELKFRGRIVLDVWRLFRHEIALQSYTFENLMFHVLHQRVPTYSYRNLSFWWEHRSNCYRYITAKHFLLRVQGTLRLLDQLDLIGRTSELARLFGIQFYEVLSRGSQFRVESMMLRQAKPLRFIATSPSVQQRAKMKAPEWLPLIFEPKSRFYTDPIIVLDFQSLYPSIIIAHNYCFSTCIGRVDRITPGEVFEFGATQLKIPNRILEKIKHNLNYSPCGVGFVKPEVRKGVLPQMLQQILETRLMVKKSMKENKQNKVLQKVLHNRQLGLKLIANVTYGYTAANFSGRMPCVEVGDSVVSKGRETLERAIKLIEDNEKWRAQVVYGDTDSLFVLVAGRSRTDAFRIGAEIAEAVTNDNPQPIKLKLEKVYQPCILQTKKRYVGYMYESLEQQEPEYLAKGIETVRRDGCPAVAKMLEKSLRILFETRDVSVVKRYVCRQFNKIQTGRVSIQDLTFAREYRGAGGYRPGACVPALELARKWRTVDKRREPRRGERVPYVVVSGPPGVPLIRLVRCPRELLANGAALRPNAPYYITRVIVPALERCFSLIGADIRSWYKEMPRRQLQYLPSEEDNETVRKSTISQYFTTLACACCSTQTQTGLCDACRAQTQATMLVLQSKISTWEDANKALLQICSSCVGREHNLTCTSLDCPVLYRRAQNVRDLKQVPFVRKLISSFKC